MYKEGYNVISCTKCGLGEGTGGVTGATRCYKTCPAGKQHNPDASKHCKRDDTCCSD